MGYAKIIIRELAAMAAGGRIYLLRTLRERRRHSMDDKITALRPSDFQKCGNIWDMERQAGLAKQFYEELAAGNRITYVYPCGQDYLGEISLVFDMDDPDYTVKGKRIYTSRLIVKPSERRKGIGRALVDYAIERAREMSYAEMSIGVDLDNYPAMKLYADAGFDQIIFIGEDEQGKYMKLLKRL